MNYLKSTVNTLRDRYAPVTHTSTFRQTGQITPDEFLAAGDYLVYKFPTWSWADADHPDHRVAYLPPGKQFLVTRNVPCHRRLDEHFAGDAAHEEAIVDDGKDFRQAQGLDQDDGWLRTGGLTSSQPLKAKDVRLLGETTGPEIEVEVDDDDEDEIPDMEDEDDDEAIIRDVGADAAHRYAVIALLPLLPLLSLTVITPPAAAGAPTTSTSPTRPTTAPPDSFFRDTWPTVSPCRQGESWTTS